MKIFLDNKLTRLLHDNPSKIVNNALISDSHNAITFGWSSRLEYLGVESIFKTLPAFAPSELVFEACIKVLCENEDKEVIFHLFDTLFTDCLNQVKNLSQIKPAYLLQAIKMRRQDPAFQITKNVVSIPLDTFEAALKEDTANTTHDLIFYLAWDRICTYLSRIFDNPLENPLFIQNLAHLKECLIESFIHITQQGKTFPSAYKLVEALFFYNMREENIQRHSADEWEILSQTFPILSSQDMINDFMYIDEGLIPNDEFKNKNNIESADFYMTLDTFRNVNSLLALAKFIISKLQAEVPQWPYSFSPKVVVYL